MTWRHAERSSNHSTGGRGLFSKWLGSGGAAAVVLLVLAIDVLALVSIVSARREARAAALDEIARQTRSQARAIEALLATLRADLAFLASSPRLAESHQRVASENPLSRRWARLEAESTLLLFAEGHPPLVLLELFDSQSYRLATVARHAGRGASPADPELVATAPDPPAKALELAIAVDGGGEVRALVDPVLLLAAVVPSSSGAGTSGLDLELEISLSTAPVTLEATSGVDVDVVGDDDVVGDAEVNGDAEVDAVASESIDITGWDGAASMRLRRSEAGGVLLPAVENLAARWRLTLLLNLVVISLGVPLAIVAVRSTRRAARLAAEREHAEQRRQLEQRLWQQERLATVGRLAASIAHEINNPLAGMTNHLTLLEEELGAGDLAHVQRRSARVGDGIERIRQIVQRTLHLARPGSGAREPVDLVTLAAETVALIASREQAGRVRLRTEPETDVPVVVEGERALLSQLLTNLILNALDFGGGKPIDILFTQDATETTVVVEDQGPGIDPQVADRLFEPFVSSRGSTGLGLAVCHGIVRQHGGSIAGENRGSSGARFVVRLPRTTAIDARLETTRRQP
jgi:signal transduction histidine kinase